ncbi:unnamed protein product [Pleuronectes platessa]|uniref:Uncharacterized protein n=1 Tax=Pleuronectes platessa TaxID=8262 RepID=A0A9N7UEU1_PLEPL|nr:unnamed protein product [Pleuronectes platessa]
MKRDHSAFLLPAQPVDLWDCRTVPPTLPRPRTSTSLPLHPHTDCFLFVLSLPPLIPLSFLVLHVTMWLCMPFQPISLVIPSFPSISPPVGVVSGAAFFRGHPSKDEVYLAHRICVICVTSLSYLYCCCIKELTSEKARKLEKTGFFDIQALDISPATGAITSLNTGLSLKRSGPWDRLARDVIGLQMHPLKCNTAYIWTWGLLKAEVKGRGIKV